MTYKIGLIGTGLQGKRYAETLSRMPSCKLITPCNRSGSYNGLKCFTDYHDLLDLKLDGVIIAADPVTNFEMIKYANFIGTPVLVEKPVGLYLSDIQKLEKLKTPILVNYIHLFNPTYQFMKSSIKSKINRVISIGYNQGPIRHYSALYDYMPHDLSMLFDLVPGEYDIVAQRANRANDGILYRCELKCGQVELQILAGNGGSERQRKLAVFCEDGDQFVFDDTRSKDYKAPMNNLLEHFVEVIEGAKPNPSFDLTVKVHEILYKLGARYAAQH